MTATAGARSSTIAFRRYSKPRSAPCGCRAAPRRTASRSPRSARRTAASSATDAHIENDECGAPEFYTHGAKLRLADGTGAKLTPESIAAALDGVSDDVHPGQPHRSEEQTT